MKRPLWPLIVKGQQLTGLPIVTEMFFKQRSWDNAVIGCCPLAMAACALVHEQQPDLIGLKLANTTERANIIQFLEDELGLSDADIEHYYRGIDDISWADKRHPKYQLAREHRRRLGF